MLFQQSAGSDFAQYWQNNTLAIYQKKKKYQKVDMQYPSTWKTEAAQLTELPNGSLHISWHLYIGCVKVKLDKV